MLTSTLPDGHVISYPPSAKLVVNAQGNWYLINKHNEEIINQGVWDVNATKWLQQPTIVKQGIKTEPLAKNQELKDIKIGELFNYKKLSDYKGLKGKIPIRADTTFVGVEVELEKVNIKNISCSTWKITDDGSLKDKGREFVSVPIPFRFLEVELWRLFNGLSHSFSSSRCSVHIHLNSRDFNLEELKTFIALYMIFEKSLYKFSGDRWNNIFCVPLFASPYIVSEFIKKLDNTKFIPERWNKYFGFNLCPLYGGESHKIGTIEFRHMIGNTNIEWIVNWVNLIVSLKITAKKIPFNDLIMLLETMNTTSAYVWLAGETFKDFAPFLLKQASFKEDVETCITQTKAVFLSPKEAKTIIKKGK